jgi:hypothetical protein
VFLSQGLEYDGEKEGANKDETVTFEQTQDITDNTDRQSNNVDTIVETHRTSARNKKTPSTRGDDFLW